MSYLSLMVVFISWWKSTAVGLDLRPIHQGENHASSWKPSQLPGASAVRNLRGDLILFPKTVSFLSSFWSLLYHRWIELSPLIQEASYNRWRPSQTTIVATIHRSTDRGEPTYNIIHAPKAQGRYKRWGRKILRVGYPESLLSDCVS